MSDPFISEIRLFPYTYAPSGWAFCNGQLVQINQYSALYSLIGTIHGGDGRTTFGLPNLKGRTAMHAGQGPGLTPHNLGHYGGLNSVPLESRNLPPHTHTAFTEYDISEFGSPTNNVLGVLQDSSKFGNSLYYDPTEEAPPTTTAYPNFLAKAGQGQAHENRQPYLVIPYCIALVGIYPSRS